MISGIVSSFGISFGTALILKNNDIFEKKYININDIDNEIKKFFLGYKNTINELKEIQKRANKIFDNNEEEIFVGQILLLEDSTLLYDIKYLIENNLYTSETAINEVMKYRINEININNKYLKYRNTDIKDVYIRLINSINNNNFINNFFNNNNNILILEDIYPSYMLQINLKNILGIITEKGNYNSHSSIIARSFNIPMISGVCNITKLVKNNDYIIIDAINNNIYINPSSKKICELQKLKNKYISEKTKILESNNIKLITKDNCKINLYYNINLDNDIKNINNNFIDGIGLYRTEFLFINRKLIPTEEEQFNIYKKLTLLTNGIVNIRILNLGGDNINCCLKLKKEYNPSLGLKGIRILLKMKNILHDQLKAILRSSAFGNIRILYPMISTYEEVEELNNELNLVKTLLYDNKVSFNENIKVGIMVEVPSLIFILPSLVKKIDFFNIGTNDLIQYLFAVDRNNENVSYLYNFLYPGNILFIKKIIDIFIKNNKEFCICGELTNNEKLIPLLIGLGIKSFSINVDSVYKIKEIIRKIDLESTKNMSNNILKQSKLEDVIKILDNFNKLIM